MANMSLGTLTFAVNPSECPLLNPDNSCAYEETYTAVAVFDWGTDIVGKEIPLGFTFMPADMYDDLDDLNQVGDPLVWNPQNGSGKTYNVKILKLTGKYHVRLGATAGDLRKDVTLLLLILSEV
jgi:hypothetical protein